MIDLFGLLQAYKSHCDQLMQVVVKEPRADNALSTRSIFSQDGSPLTVFSDIPGVCDFLTRPEFKLGKVFKDVHLYDLGLAAQKS
jgi:hypothetical protein